MSISKIETEKLQDKIELIENLIYGAFVNTYGESSLAKEEVIYRTTDKADKEEITYTSEIIINGTRMVAAEYKFRAEQGYTPDQMKFTCLRLLLNELILLSADSVFRSWCAQANIDPNDRYNFFNKINS